MHTFGSDYGYWSLGAKNYLLIVPLVKIPDSTGQKLSWEESISKIEAPQKHTLTLL